MNNRHCSGSAGDQNASRWEYYASKQFHEISSAEARALFDAKEPYQIVSFAEDRPIKIVSINIGFPTFIYRQFHWEEGASSDMVFDALHEPKHIAFLSSFTWYGYESLHLDPIFRVDISPKRNGTIYYGARNLQTGEHSLDSGQFDISDLWMPIPDFGAYDELKKWQREPVFTLANRLVQESKKRWNLP